MVLVLCGEDGVGERSTDDLGEWKTGMLVNGGFIPRFVLAARSASSNEILHSQLEHGPCKVDVSGSKTTINQYR